MWRTRSLPANSISVCGHLLIADTSFRYQKLRPKCLQLLVTNAQLNSFGSIRLTEVRVCSQCLCFTVSVTTNHCSDVERPAAPDWRTVLVLRRLEAPCVVRQHDCYEETHPVAGLCGGARERWCASEKAILRAEKGREKVAQPFGRSL